MSECRISALAAANLLAVGLLTGGCVSTSLRLSQDHPARSSAPSSTGLEPAAILRPNAPLYQAEPPDVAPEEVAVTPAGTREAPFVGQGFVREINEGRLRIEHGQIPGFMAAMTMGYPIVEEATSDSLEVGDEIIFRIEVLQGQGYRIFSVDAVPAVPAEILESEITHEHDAPGSTGSPTAPTPRP